tara:strand:+ start:164962 stop:165816 length:855 start_codon:yes stop_codon:yes gene_type:complete
MMRVLFFLLFSYSLTVNAQENKIFNNCLNKESISDTINCLENCIQLFICYEINNDLSLLKLNNSQEKLKATISITDDGSFLLENYKTSNLTIISALKRVVYITSKEAEGVINNNHNLTNQKIYIDLIFSKINSNKLAVTNNSGEIIYEFEIKNNHKESLENVDTELIIPPIFPGCEIEDFKERKKCMSFKIDEYIKENYNTGLFDKIVLQKDTVQINVSFKLNSQGKISNVIAKGPHKLIEKEAIRVLTSLPQMIPGKQNGKDVSLLYSLPIIFEVEGSSKTKK